MKESKDHEVVVSGLVAQYLCMQSGHKFSSTGVGVRKSSVFTHTRHEVSVDRVHIKGWEETSRVQLCPWRSEGLAV